MLQIKFLLIFLFFFCFQKETDDPEQTPSAATTSQFKLLKEW